MGTQAAVMRVPAPEAKHGVAGRRAFSSLGRRDLVDEVNVRFEEKSSHFRRQRWEAEPPF